MPKTTFFNLPEEKRQKIENVAIKEFKEHTFKASSINRIVEGAGISKGSFYQYFLNKEDIYRHILQIAGKKKLEFMSPQLMNYEELDMFTLIQELYIAGMKFAVNYPDLVAIGEKILTDRTHILYNEYIMENMQEAYTLFQGFLKSSIAKGEIREDIDIKFMSYMIANMNVLIVNYYTNEKHGNYTSEDTEGLLKLSNQLVDLLKVGLEKSTQNHKGGNGND